MTVATHSGMKKVILDYLEKTGEANCMISGSAV